jgi:hypothetical protein
LSSSFSPLACPLTPYLHDIKKNKRKTKQNKTTKKQQTNQIHKSIFVAVVMGFFYVVWVVVEMVMVVMVVTMEEKFIHKMD